MHAVYVHSKEPCIVILSTLLISTHNKSNQISNYILFMFRSRKNFAYVTLDSCKLQTSDREHFDCHNLP